MPKETVQLLGNLRSNSSTFSQNPESNKKVVKEFKRNLNKLIGKCKYCNPNWSYVSNFAEACKGYDVPMGNPNPGNIIFHHSSNNSMVSARPARLPMD